MMCNTNISFPIRDLSEKMGQPKDNLGKTTQLIQKEGR